MSNATFNTVLIAICALGISAMAGIQIYQFSEYLGAKQKMEQAEVMAEHCRLMRAIGTSC